MSNKNKPIILSLENAVRTAVVGAFALGIIIGAAVACALLK